MGDCCCCCFHCWCCCSGVVRWLGGVCFREGWMMDEGLLGRWRCAGHGGVEARENTLLYDMVGWWMW